MPGHKKTQSLLPSVIGSSSSTTSNVISQADRNKSDSLLGSHATSSVPTSFSQGKLTNGSRKTGKSSKSTKLAHLFEISSFFRPVYCAVCTKLLGGLFRQGLECTACGCIVHEMCQKKALECLGKDSVVNSSKIDLNITHDANHEDVDLVVQLEINVIMCKNLAKQFSFTLKNHPDPYVEIQVGQCIVKTVVKMHTLDPVWNQKFKIDVPMDGTMTFTVYDSLKKHRFLGIVVVDIPTLLAQDLNTGVNPIARLQKTHADQTVTGQLFYAAKFVNPSQDERKVTAFLRQKKAETARKLTHPMFNSNDAFFQDPQMQDVVDTVTYANYFNHDSNGHILDTNESSDVTLKNISSQGSNKNLIRTKEALLQMQDFRSTEDTFAEKTVAGSGAAALPPTSKPQSALHIQAALNNHQNQRRGSTTSATVVNHIETFSDRLQIIHSISNDPFLTISGANKDISKSLLPGPPNRPNLLPVTSDSIEIDFEYEYNNNTDDSLDTNVSTVETISTKK